MKYTDIFRSSLIALAGLGFASYAAAENAVQKIGFINTERIYLESKQARNIQTELEQEFGSRQQSLSALQQEGEKVEKKLAQNTLKSSEREATVRKFQELLNRFRKQQAELAEDYNLRRNEEFAALQNHANQVVAELAKQEGYDVILQDVVYVDSRYDITDQVIKKLDAR